MAVGDSEFVSCFATQHAAFLRSFGVVKVNVGRLDKLGPEETAVVASRLRSAKVSTDIRNFFSSTAS